MEGKKRPTIGFLIPNLLGEYYEIQWFSLNQSAQEYDVNLIIFSPFMFLTNVSNKEEFINTFQFPHETNVDGIIISSGAMRGYFSVEEVESMCNFYKNVPVVSLSEDFEGIPSVSIDNKQGMRDLIEHFVKDHGYKKIAFIRGNVNNHEAELRFSAYKEVLTQYNIPIDDQMIFQGDFGLHSGERAVAEFLDERRLQLDAIIAANDDMILGAFSELQTRGIKIPEEIALGGFDNIKAVKEVDPPISTVQQPFDGQVQKALEILLNMIKKEEYPERLELAARPVIRRSCGCEYNAELPSEESDEYKYYKYSRIKEDKQKYDNTQQGYNLGFITEFSTAIMNALSFTVIKNQLKDLMQKLSIQTCYIYFYKEKRPVFILEDPVPPEYSELFFAFREGQRLLYEEGRTDCNPLKFIPVSNFFETSRHTLVFTELIFQNEHHGYFVLEMSKINPLVINLFRSQFTNCLHNIYIHSKLEQAYTKLKDLDKAKTEFFVNISHEFRTPLTLILGPLESVLRGDFGNQYRNESDLFKAMLSNGTQLLNLINNLLDFSKIEAGRMVLRKQRTNITSILKKYVDSVMAAANLKGLYIAFKDETEKEVSSFVDQGLIEKAIFNLISNALKFTPEGGTITISIASTPKDYTIKVADTGIGIPKDQHENIFNRFTQVDGSISRKYSGTGIGLAFSKEIVELHGGSITVDSVEGEGSTFSILMPFEYLKDFSRTSAEDSDEVDESFTSRLVETGYMMEELSDDDEPVIVGNRKKILLVEDNKGMRTFIKKLLKKDYAVYTAANGREGYELANIYLPDLIVSDIMMPEINGYQFTNMVKKNSSLLHTPVILLSAKTDVLEKIEGFEMGADDYLTKPFNADELRARIKSQLTMKALRDKLVQERDILIKAIKERKKLKVEKEAAEKANKIKNEFLANVSHEIRTPISAILGFSELLLQNEIDSNAKRKLDIIQESGNHLLGLVNDILDFSKISVDKIELFYISFSLRDLLSIIYHMFSIKAKEKKIDFTLNISEKVPEFVFGDKKRIRQIVLNLLSNAFKFTKAGSINIDLTYSSGVASISISDTGIGIEKRKQSNIFNAFSQADSSTTREYGGIGLGLAITKKLTEKMNGTIQVESHVGKGSRFLVELPLPLSEKNSEPAPPEISMGKDSEEDVEVVVKELEHDFSYIKVLLVENKKGRQLIFSNLMEALNLEFEIAESTSDLILRLKEGKFSVLFLDIQMENINSLSFISDIRNDKQLKNIFAIAFSPDDSKEDLEKYLEAGYDEYISEIMDLSRFRQRFEKLVAKYKGKKQTISGDEKVLAIVAGKEKHLKELLERLKRNCDLFNSSDVLNLAGQVGGFLTGNGKDEFVEKLKEAGHLYDDDLLLNSVNILESLLSDKKDRA